MTASILGPVAEKFRIERYRRSDRDQVFALIRAALPVDAGERLIRQWDWKYDANPFNSEAERDRRMNREKLSAVLSAANRAVTDQNRAPRWDVRSEENPEREDDPYLVLAKSGRDEVMAMGGSVPQRLMVGGEERFASIGCDWIVHPAYRGQHLGSRLYSRYGAEQALIFGYSNARSREVTADYHRATADRRESAEWAAVVGVVPLVKPLDWGHLAERMTHNRWLARAATAAAASIRTLKKPIERLASLPEVDVTEIDSFDDRVDGLWQRACGDYPVIGVRDRRYLNWRFVARPDARYRLLAAVRRSGLIGYMAFRLVVQDRVPWGYVVDYLVENRSRELFSLLLRHSQERMAREGARAIVSTVANAPYRAMLWRHGFFPSGMRAYSYFGAGVQPEAPQFRAFIELRRWFLTMADADLDMAF